MTNLNPRNELLGYLLEALEPGEREAMARSLAADPVLARQLEVLRTGLEPLAADRGHWDPPPHLAERTCQFVYQRADALPVALSPVEVASQSASAWTAADHPPRRRWSMLDMAMAAAVLIAASALLFPAVYQSRINSQWIACQNNLQNIGRALASYSSQHQGRFPEVPETGKRAAAGIYAPTLVSQGYLNDPSTLVCPSSDVAQSGSFRVPSLADLEQANSEALHKLQAQMGGSYGYSLGYRQNGQYKPIVNLQRKHFAIMADKPGSDLKSSPNHALGMENVLIEDGHVIRLKGPREVDGGDDIYTNDNGRQAAGLHKDDAVIVPSDHAP